MDIPVINFEAGINSLNNPSLISRFLSIFELGKLSPDHRLWKWGAIFLALVYTFTSIINKIKILFLYYRNKSKSILASDQPLLSCFDDEFTSDEDENDDVCSTSDYSSEDDENEDEEEESEDVNHSVGEDFDFNVKGSLRNFSENTRQKRKIKGRVSFRRKRSFIDNISLSDFVNGESVVKLWDGLSLGVVDVNNAFSFLDFNNNEYMWNSSTSIFDAISPSSKVFLSGDGNIWDLRTGSDSPAVHSNRKGKVVRVDSGRTGKVYVRDDASTALTACDVRKFDTPLTEEVTAFEDDDLWWDADGVNNEFGELD